MNVWRLMAHHARRERAVSWVKQHSRIAMGWGSVGDLSQQKFGSHKEIALAIERSYEQGLHLKRNFNAGGHSLWDFAHTMQVGDLVILISSHKQELVAQVEGSYEWRETTPTPGDCYHHQRRVQILQMDPELVWQAAGATCASGASVHRALARLTKAVSAEDLGQFKYLHEKNERKI